MFPYSQITYQSFCNFMFKISNDQFISKIIHYFMTFYRCFTFPFTKSTALHHSFLWISFSPSNVGNPDLTVFFLKVGRIFLFIEFIHFILTYWAFKRLRFPNDRLAPFSFFCGRWIFWNRLLMQIILFWKSLLHNQICLLNCYLTHLLVFPFECLSKFHVGFHYFSPSFSFPFRPFSRTSYTLLRNPNPILFTNGINSHPRILLCREDSFLLLSANHLSTFHAGYDCKLCILLLTFIQNLISKLRNFNGLACQ